VDLLLCEDTGTLGSNFAPGGTKFAPGAKLRMGNRVSTTSTYISNFSMKKHVCTYVCMHVCMYMFVGMYMFVCMYMYVFRGLLTSQWQPFVKQKRKKRFGKMSNMFKVKCIDRYTKPCRRGLVVSFPPAVKETEAMGREIESHQGIGW
jgi:hypothetical protein